MSKIKLTQILDKIAQYESKQIPKKEVTDFIKSIKVKKHLPLIDKINLISSGSMELAIAQKMLDTDGSITEDIRNTFIMVSELFLGFDLLFAYTNVTFEIADKTDSVYDIIKSYGIYDMVLDQCERDYKETKESIDNNTKSMIDMVYVEVLKDLSEVPETFNNFDFSKLVNDINSIDQEKLEDIKKIQEINAPFDGGKKK